MIVEGIRSLTEDVIGHGAQKKYLPIIGAFAVFIFVGNLFGLFFFLQPPTGALSTTVALALISFVYFNWQGIREHGFLGYLKHFMGPVLWLAPLFFVIELIGNFARILSLSLRLFMNIYGEHTATGIFAGLRPDRRAVASDGARPVHGAPPVLHLRDPHVGVHQPRNRPRGALKIKD
jgi:F-type H+-transporting ATPase subunit a